MDILLRESKRDNLLLSYYNAIVESGLQISFGQFKSKLLQTLSSGGGIHSLSERSNYYLAGAARYYFNGDLTLNKNLSMLNPKAWEGDVAVLDDWNDEVCKRLDACIKVLRNAYIDSVGTTFEQPEDFGTLPIGKLLRKYNKAINKVLGIVTPKKEKEAPQIDMDPNVGKNYTFEIMYSQADCQKYERPTAPGSWCITYGEGHYNYYVRHLGIHYVIFRQNGWENIERPKDPLSSPGFTRAKPHDAYGNSLIALLQSNKSPEPVYITSRWNHGREVSCEADHAYTKEEFQQITGVTDDDLKRIYDIWKANKPASNRSDNGAAKTREENKLAIRDLKYVQMRINAGENPNSLLAKHYVLAGNRDSKIQNCVSFCRVQKEGDTDRRPVLDFYFLVDRGKIIYETAIKNVYPSISGIKNGLAVFELSNYEKNVGFMYDIKSHRLLDVGGYVKFLSVPSIISDDSNRYFTVNRSASDFALIDSITKRPIQLPNGEYWSNAIKISSYDWRSHRGKYGARLLPENTVICLLYDESSGEKYFFDTGLNKFLTNLIPEGFPLDDSNPYPFNIGSTCGKFVTVKACTNDSTFRGYDATILYDREKGVPLDLGTNEYFSDIHNLKDNELFLCTSRSNRRIMFIGDAKNNRLLQYNNGDPIKIFDEYVVTTDDKYLMFVIDNEYDTSHPKEVYARILNLDTITFLTNPYHTESDPTIFRIENRSSWGIDAFYSSGLRNIITNPDKHNKYNYSGIIDTVNINTLIQHQNNNGNEF